MVGKIVTLIKKEAPDIVISTGDLVDQDLTGSTALAGLLDSIPSRYGKFAVTGNHEMFAGLPQALEFTRQAGFRMLRSDTVTIAGCLTMAGVDDPGHHMVEIAPAISEHDLLASIPRENFIVFLKHAPLVPKDATGLFDLMLSGHTHKGQIFPFSLFVHLFFKYHTGLYQLADQAHIYVSRGTGTWGPPIRFLAPPEITIITIKKE
jgi:predicted MPP superfamily phosphohydrolase